MSSMMLLPAERSSDLLLGFLTVPSSSWTQAAVRRAISMSSSIQATLQNSGAEAEPDVLFSFGHAKSVTYAEGAPERPFG